MVIALLNIGIGIRAQSDLEDRVKKVHRNLSATVHDCSRKSCTVAERLPWTAWNGMLARLRFIEV